MSYIQNIVVVATFPDLQANIFPLLFKPKDGKFQFKGFGQGGSNSVLRFLI